MGVIDAKWILRAKEECEPVCVPNEAQRGCASAPSIILFLSTVLCSFPPHQYSMRLDVASSRRPTANMHFVRMPFMSKARAAAG